MMPEEKEIREVKDVGGEYTTDINMWGMEIKRINSLLEAITNVKLYLHNPNAIKGNPQIINSVADILMEIYLTIDSYIKDAAKKTTLFNRLEDIQEEAEVIVRDFSAEDNEDYEGIEQLNSFYKHANYLHMDLLEEVDILGLRIPFKEKKDIESMLKRANR
jgi:hypothetical protein